MKKTKKMLIIISTIILISTLLITILPSTVQAEVDTFEQETMHEKSYENIMMFFYSFYSYSIIITGTLIVLLVGFGIAIMVIGETNEKIVKIMKKIVDIIILVIFVLWDLIFMLISPRTFFIPSFLTWTEAYSLSKEKKNSRKNATLIISLVLMTVIYIILIALGCLD